MPRPQPVWVPENKAAEMIGFKPATLRRKVKEGKLDVAISSINRRCLFYNANDIQKAMTELSTFIPSK